jgi:hypothetical protein
MISKRGREKAKLLKCCAGLRVRFNQGKSLNPTTLKYYVKLIVEYS